MMMITTMVIISNGGHHDNDNDDDELPTATEALTKYRFLNVKKRITVFWVFFL